ncbi:MAG: hypothetical protein DHS80DRAFT_26719 [Piptocephalis tieghemiana]|nr:MAG: hypothetical protein DHS80DRAFT_26719 [Piptocephalis tieghemiana]
MNLGGPKDDKEVYPFLHRLFADPDLIPLPFQSQIAPWIARRRTPQIVEQYNKIGGGSPILEWTRKQGEALEKRMDTLAPESAPHKVYIGMRYARPLTEDAVQAMIRDGVDRAVAFTQYPQYSCSTTGSSLNELRRQLETHDPARKIHWSILDRWADDAGLIRAFSKRITQALDTYPKEERESVVLLFSAHSLPMSVVNRGDPYPAEVADTVAGVMRALGRKNPYRLVWQSQVGPSAWLGAQTSDAIQGFGKQGIRNVLVVPIAFTSDHIETLFELDLEYGHLAKEAGVTGYKRVESLNDMPEFIDGMASLLKGHLESGMKSTGKQFSLQCPSCKKEVCRVTKDYFEN